MRKTVWDRLLAKIKRECKRRGIPLRVIGPNQCPVCGYDSTEDLKVAERLRKGI